MERIAHNSYFAHFYRFPFAVRHAVRFFFALQTLNFQRLMGLSVFAAAPNAIVFHLASPFARMPPKGNPVYLPYLNTPLKRHYIAGTRHFSSLLYFVRTIPLAGNNSPLYGGLTVTQRPVGVVSKTRRRCFGFPCALILPSTFCYGPWCSDLFFSLSATVFRPVVRLVLFTRVGKRFRGR